MENIACIYAKYNFLGAAQPWPKVVKNSLKRGDFKHFEKNEIFQMHFLAVLTLNFISAFFIVGLNNQNINNRRKKLFEISASQI